ncbi:succinate dehydrogenase cytochrome b subunit [Bacteroidota bacterium]
MNWFLKLMSSSLGKKYVMALTGLFLCTFLVVHMIGNLQLFKSDNGMAFNLYAVLMTTNPLIKTVSYLLYAFIVLHAIQGIRLVFQNKSSRPVQYAVYDGKSNSSWASRNMGLLGTLLLVFLVVHMSDFWWEYKFGHVPYATYATNIETGEVKFIPAPADYKQFNKIEENVISTADGQYRIVTVKNLYLEVKEGFKAIWLVALYIIAMAAVSFHLFHGFKSAFQTFGLNHSKYNGIINFIGVWGFAIAIPLAFAAMPIYFFINQ